jgi:hypothetical protein
VDRFSRAVPLALGIAVLAPCSPAAAGSVPFVFNGTVDHVAPGSGSTYVAGTFTEELRATGGGVIARAGTGEFDAASSPPIDGNVLAAVADGDGGWYVDGVFDRVGGLRRNGIAHVEATGAVDPGWLAGGGDASCDFDQLAVDGAAIYATCDDGGVVGVDRHSGAVLPWDPDADGYVTSIAAANGIVYLAGDFTHVGGQARAGLAAVDADGRLTPWDPRPAPALEVDDPRIAIGPGAIYVVGGFTRIGGEPRDGIAALDPTSGRATAWDPHVVWTKKPWERPAGLVVAGRTV